ncbi:DNA mismatch repair protein PMS1-like [Lathyrus oleraceus]|uniref:DNA mismatch repair protein PMS1-like n=1 Tax=Pisum sativum TaxID=3888 RepID=UPI0021D2653A|nr:DNA mismatch repair protein PMS1-like [Pisum sativum]
MKYQQQSQAQLMHQDVFEQLMHGQSKLDPSRNNLLDQVMKKLSTAAEHPRALHPSLSSAVKELVENSLDAGATSIKISLKDFGEEWFQVIDSGCGISPNNCKVLALKHHTSKLSEFHDLQSLITFSFRGEASSSLCALGNLTVETKTARQVGTTVTVKKLFYNLLVRSKEFKRNIHKEYGKLVSLLNTYALIAKGVRFGCTNTTGKNAKPVVLKTQGNDSLKDNIIKVLAMNTFNCLEPMSLCISESCEIDGFLSKPGLGKSKEPREMLLS